MKRFLLFTVVFFTLGLSFSAQAQFSFGETAGDTSLPVTLSAFTTTTWGDNVTLHWRTETEVNNLGFGIYRCESKDGNYTKIAFVSGAGSSAMPIDYQFTDQEVGEGKTYFYYLEDIDIAGEKGKSKIIKVVVPPAKPVPKEFQLLQNYPNPFNPETWIPYQIKETAEVVIRIYSTSGQLVRTLHLGPQTAGFYRSRTRAAYWNGKNEAGEKVASGVYFYHLQAGDFSAVRRMLVVK